MSSLRGSGVLALWIDIVPELQREADAWYLQEHLPERIVPGGYLRARRYKSVAGSPAYLSLFEADTPEDLASPGYLRIVRQISVQSQRMRAGFRNVARNTFRVAGSIGTGTGGIVASLRFKSRRPEAAAQHGWIVDSLLPDIGRHPCVVATHYLEAAPDVRARMDAVRAVGQGDALVEHVLLIEVAHEAELGELRAGPLAPGRLAGRDLVEEAYAVYRLMYAVSRDDMARPSGA